MANVNKVVLNGDTLIDLTRTTAEAADVKQGKTFLGKDGALWPGQFQAPTLPTTTMKTGYTLTLSGDYVDGNLGIIYVTEDGSVQAKKGTYLDMAGTYTNVLAITVTAPSRDLWHGTVIDSTNGTKMSLQMDRTSLVTDRIYYLISDVEYVN